MFSSVTMRTMGWRPMTAQRRSTIFMVPDFRRLRDAAPGGSRTGVAASWARLLDHVCLQVVPVHCDSEPGRLVELEAAVRVVERLVDERVIFVKVPLRCLEFVEGRHSHHHLRAGDDVDRPRGIMWRHWYVVRLARCRDQLELGDAAGR